MKRQMIYLFGILSGVSLLSSCVPLAAGAAGGYLLHREGYRVQNPLERADVKVQSPIIKQPRAQSYDVPPADPAY